MANSPEVRQVNDELETLLRQMDALAEQARKLAKSPWMDPDTARRLGGVARSLDAQMQPLGKDLVDRREEKRPPQGPSPTK